MKPFIIISLLLMGCASRHCQPTKGSRDYAKSKDMGAAYHYIFICAMLDKYERLAIEGEKEEHRAFARQQLAFFRAAYKAKLN